MQTSTTLNQLETQKDIDKYADEIISKVKSFKNNKKFQMLFLKHLNDLLAAAMDIKDIQKLEKDLSDQYNKILSQNHKKEKKKEGAIKKLDMRNGFDDEEYYDDDNEDEDDDYKKFK